MLPSEVHACFADIRIIAHSPIAFERARSAPFVYPPGWGYRRWEIGAFLPPVFLVRDYWYTDWDLLGLPPPPPDYQWVRYGPDLLLIDLTSGEVVEVVYDVFYY